MRFFVQLFSSWHEFNWHRASRRPSATVELFVSGLVAVTLSATSCAQKKKLPWRIHKKKKKKNWVYCHQQRQRSQFTHVAGQLSGCCARQHRIVHTIEPTVANERNAQISTTAEMPAMESRDTCLVSRPSRDVFLMSRSWLCLDTSMSRLGSCLSSFHVSSCLMSRDCVLTVSLTDIAKCLFCAETLAFLAQRSPFTRCLLTYYGRPM